MLNCGKWARIDDDKRGADRPGAGRQTERQRAGGDRKRHQPKKVSGTLSSFRREKGSWHLSLSDTLVAPLAIAGCNKSTDDLGKDFDGIVSGMTLEEVEAHRGSGQEITCDQLPQLYREILFPKAEGVIYRKWTREAGMSKATLYAGSRDGKISGNPSIEKLDQRTVRAGGS